MRRWTGLLFSIHFLAVRNQVICQYQTPWCKPTLPLHYYSSTMNTGNHEPELKKPRIENTDTSSSSEHEDQVIAQKSPPANLPSSVFPASTLDKRFIPDPIDVPSSAIKIHQTISCSTSGEKLDSHFDGEASQTGDTDSTVCLSDKLDHNTESKSAIENQDKKMTSDSTQDKGSDQDSHNLLDELPFLEPGDFGTCSHPAGAIKVKKGRAMVDVSVENIDGATEEISAKRKKKKRSPNQPAKPSPNAFISVRISSLEIQQKLGEVQKGMLEYDKKLKSTFVSLEKCHITLMVVRLNNNEEIEKAKGALRETTKMVVSNLGLQTNTLVLNFSGVGNFSKNVVFGKIEDGPSNKRFASVTEIVHRVFNERNLPSTDDRPFSPHLTIAKISKARKKLRGIPPESYANFTTLFLGSQEIEGLELLSMELPPADDGYYHCFQRYSFGDFYT